MFVLNMNSPTAVCLAVMDKGDGRLQLIEDLVIMFLMKYCCIVVIYKVTSTVPIFTKSARYMFVILIFVTHHV